MSLAAIPCSWRRSSVWYVTAICVVVVIVVGSNGKDQKKTEGNRHQQKNCHARGGNPTMNSKTCARAKVELIRLDVIIVSGCFYPK
mmetsp:Transcript_8008/g.11846  ORF Transcript_8008/g.11846 Transcript_8008/m.11846 type:complete len:86 (-) Transcript_8008:518-775(-)